MKKTTAEADPKAAAKLRELIQQIAVAMITTVTPDGALHSRPMVTLDSSIDGELWFLTADNSGKARDLAEEQAVNVSYADPKKQRFVSVSGSASVGHSAERVRELWRKGLELYFPNGRDDPRLAIMTVRIDRAEFWDVGVGEMVSLHEQPGTDRAGAAHRTGEHTRIDIRATPTSG